MKRVIEIEMNRAVSGERAIKLFFKLHPELNYWRETFECMLDDGINFFSDDKLADGTRNENWAYALHLDSDGEHTYICVIERQ